MEIEIRRTALWGILAAALLPALMVLGHLASPRDDDGRPLLLLPEVRMVEAYRRTARDWMADWRALDEQLGSVLAAPDAALLAQSRTAQQAFDSAVALARQVEGTGAPPAMLGLREQALAAATAYVDASVAVNRWLSAPSVENTRAARRLQVQAQAALRTLESNHWLADAAATPQPEGH